MQYIGTDIIEISRIKNAVTNRGDRFLQRVFTGREIELYRDHLPSLAARFAAKEAVIKALDAANRGINFKDIEILAGPNGRPEIFLHGAALKLSHSLKIGRFAVSLSHSRNYAIAMVIGEIPQTSM
jgi:holo-[acyl-carrier protein] synthase